MPELAKLLERTRQHPSAELRPEDVHTHFAVCASCRDQFEALSRLNQELKDQLTNPEMSASAAPQAECPGAEVWGEIAGGLIDPDQALAYIEHASHCDYC